MRTCSATALVRLKARSRAGEGAADNIRIVTHTFSGGYDTRVHPLGDLEKGESSQGYRRFKVQNTKTIGGFLMVDTARGEVPKAAKRRFAEIFG